MIAEEIVIPVYQQEGELEGHFTPVSEHSQRSLSSPAMVGPIVSVNACFKTCIVGFHVISAFIKIITQELASKSRLMSRGIKKHKQCLKFVQRSTSTCCHSQKILVSVTVTRSSSYQKDTLMCFSIFPCKRSTAKEFIYFVDCTAYQA